MGGPEPDHAPTDPARAIPRVLLLFLDGVGIGPADPDVNPFLQAELPHLSGALGGRMATLEDPSISGPLGRSFPIDARLGVPGLPQSGTGQVSLLTGRNAPALLGRHFGPWPPARLRPTLERENVLARVRARGERVQLANAFPPGYPEGHSSRRVAAPPLAALGAGLRLRTVEDLLAGRALTAEIVHDTWRRRLGLERLPEITERDAGGRLARLAEEAGLTLFAHYATDMAGHRGGMTGAVQALERVDRFLGGILSALPAGCLLMVASDHGNLEDIRAGHTLNPALGLLLGESFGPLPPPPSDLTEVSGFLLSLLGDGSEAVPG